MQTMNKETFTMWAERWVINPLIKYVDSRVTTKQPQLTMIAQNDPPTQNQFNKAVKRNFKPFEAPRFDNINIDDVVTYYQKSLSDTPDLTEELVKATIHTIRECKYFLQGLPEGNITVNDFEKLRDKVAKGKEQCVTAHAGKGKKYVSFKEAYEETESFFGALKGMTFLSSGSEDAHTKALEHIERKSSQQFPVMFNGPSIP